MDAERRWDFGRYMPPGYEGEGYGTADCTMVQGSRLFVIDFKYGKSPAGRVSAERNPQMMLYALGAYEALKMLYPIKEARLAIVQPRLPDGISGMVLQHRRVRRSSGSMSGSRRRWRYPGTRVPRARIPAGSAGREAGARAGRA